MTTRNQMVHLRIQEQLYRRVGEAARERGVSAAREVNERLLRSFDRDPVIKLAADVRRLINLQGGRDSA